MRRHQTISLALASIAAIAASSAAHAQAQPEDSAQDENENRAPKNANSSPSNGGDIIVTGSRTIRDGSKAPTPVTVVGSELLNATAPANISDALMEMPQFRSSQSTRSSGLISTVVGQNFLNLRALGTQRGLVLLDGRRFVNANTTGGVDINLFPQALVSRVDVVTGGASAAYGSDAVAGVTNFILDTRFEGLKVEGQYGLTDQGDGKNYKLSAAFGGTFADGRGHIIAAIEYADSNGLVGTPYTPDDDHPIRNSARVRIPNPAVNAGNPASASNPRFIIIDRAQIASSSYTSVVQSGPFANMTFSPNGSLIAYDPGSPRSGAFGSGGDGWNPTPGTAIENPLQRGSLFVRASFDLSDNLSVFAEASAAKAESTQNQHPSYTQSTFSTGVFLAADNPFFSDATRAQLAANGLTGLRVNTVFQQLPLRVANALSNTQRYVIGFDGKFGEGWRWNAYYQHGENNFDLRLYNNLNLPAFLLAIDAVRDPADQIVCRSTLTTPLNGCVPINIIGNNPISVIGQAYVNGTQATTQVTKQDVFEAQVNGSPFATWAGDVNVAFGGGYRREGTKGVADPLSTAINPVTGARTGAWGFQNTAPIQGKYSLWEVFGEVEIPLATDLPFAKSISFNGAARYTDYRLSGGVTTWKAGLTWEVVEGVRLRATRSRDIRAGTLSELFGTPTTVPATVVDSGLATPVTYVTQQVQSGNTSILPEKADTYTLGIVLQPRFLPGFLASIDYYNIDIKGGIGSLAPQQILDQCVGGSTALCSLITRDPVSNLIQSIAVQQLNLNNIKTNGIDIELGYRTPLSSIKEGWDGNLSLRAFASYQPDYSNIAPGATPINLAGGNTRPDWVGKVVASYDRGPFGLTIEEQWVGAQKIDPTLTDIDIARADNRLPFYMTTDLSVRYRIEMKAAEIEVFGVVENLFDRDPDISWNRNFFQTPYVSEVYNGIGRAFRFGVRAKL